MAKISSWHFCHLLKVVWLKKACKRGFTGTAGPHPPLATSMDALYISFYNKFLAFTEMGIILKKMLKDCLHYNSVMTTAPSQNSSQLVSDFY